MTIDLVKELKNRKIIFGPKVAIKQIKKGAVEIIYIADDCPSVHVQAIQTSVKASKEGKVEIKQLKITTEQLQGICKKPFNISIISVLKRKQKKKEKEEKKAKEKKIKAPAPKTVKTKIKKTVEKKKQKKETKIKSKVKSKKTIKKKK